MTKLTKNQRATVVRLFAGGITMDNIAESHGIKRERVEAVVREALLAMPEFKPVQKAEDKTVEQAQP